MILDSERNFIVVGITADGPGTPVSWMPGDDGGQVNVTNQLNRDSDDPAASGFGRSSVPGQSIVSNKCPRPAKEEILDAHEEYVSMK